MARISLYRSFPVALLVAAVCWTGGCEDMSKSHQTLSEQQYNRWNLARVGIMYQLAKQQYEVGDYDKCKKTLKESLALKAPYAPLQTLAGKLEIEKGSLESAAEHLKEAARLDPQAAEPLYLLGVVYQRWQKMDVAEDYYQQAWDRKQDEALYMLAVVEMKITLGQLDDAQKLLESKLVYFEQSAAVRIALARIAELKKDYDKACKYYADATILMPDDQKVRRSYADALFEAKKYNEAASIFEDMRTQEKLEDRDSLLLMLSQAYLHLHRPFDARNCLQELVRDDPNNVAAYLTLGEACVDTGDLSIAQASAHKILRLEPANEKAMVLSAVVLQKQQRWADAAAMLEKALQVAPTDSTALCMRGISAQKLGNTEEAIAFYQKAMDANPNDSWASTLLMKAKPGAGPAGVGLMDPIGEPRQGSGAKVAQTTDSVREIKSR